MFIKMPKSLRHLALTSIEARVLKGPYQPLSQTLKISIPHSMQLNLQRRHLVIFKRYPLHMIQILLMLQKIFMINRPWQGCWMPKDNTRNLRSTHHTRKLLVESKRCQWRQGCRRTSNSYRQFLRRDSSRDSRKWALHLHCWVRKKHS